MPSRRKREPSPNCSCQGGTATCGKAATYNRHKCGCDPCVNSQRERVAANVAKRRAAVPQVAEGATALVATSVTPSESAKTSQGSTQSPATPQILNLGPKTVPAAQIWRPPGWKPLDRDYEVADKPGRKK